MKKFKRAAALILCIAMMLGTLPAFAADKIGADVIVADAKLSNPYYEVGDLVSISLYIKNIGDEAMKLGWAGVDNLVGLKSHGSNWNWTRPVIYPGQTIEFVVNAPFEVTDEAISIGARCNSSPSVTTEPSANQGNNYSTFSFTPIKTKHDLVIKDVSVSDLNFAEGNAVNFDIEYRNIGIEEIPYGTVSIDLNVNGKNYTFTDVSSVEGRETRKLKTDNIYIEGDSVNVTAYINADETMAEDNYDNNSFTKTINAAKPGKYGYTWASLRLGGGGAVRDAFIHPKFKDEIYIGSDVNGVFKFDPYSRMNIPLNETTAKEWENIKFFLEMASAYDNPNILFNAGGNYFNGAVEATSLKCALFRSFDKGKSWQPLEIPFEYAEESDGSNGTIAIDPNNSNILYSVSVRDGLWKTTNALDRSVKWERAALPGYTAEMTGKANIASIVFDEKSAVKDGKTQTFYVSADTYGIFKTTDGGNSFELISTPVSEFQNLFIDKLGRLVASGYNGVFRYDGSGWTDISPLKNTKFRIDVNPNNANMIAATNISTIYITVDGGITWKDILKDSTVVNQMPWQPTSWYKDNVQFVRFDPHYNNRLYYGDWFGAFVIDDPSAEKVAVQDITYGIEELCSRALVCLPEGADTRLVYGAHDVNGLTVDTLFEFPENRTEEPGMQETVGIGFAEKQPNFVVRVGGYSRGTGAGNAGYTTDGGKTWTRFPTYPTKSDGVTYAQNGKVAVSCDFNDDGKPTILATVLNDYVYRSTDLGETWTPVTSLPQKLVERYIDVSEPVAADKENKDIFYAYDRWTGDFYTSTDGGASFSKKSTIPTGDAYSQVVPVAGKEGHVYVALSGNGLWYSKNYGATFEKVEGVNNAYGFDLGIKAPCSDEMTMYVLGNVNSNNGVFRSTDLGKTWAKISDEKQQTFWNRIEFLKADRRQFGVVYVASHGNGILTGFPSQLDLVLPRCGIYNVRDGKIVNKADYTVEGGSTKSGTAYITVNGEATEQKLDENNRYSLTAKLNLGENSISVYTTDESGQKSNTVNTTVNYDPNYLGLNVNSEGLTTIADAFSILGSINDDPRHTKVYVNGVQASVDPVTGVFSQSVSLLSGDNPVEVVAVKGSVSEQENVVVKCDREAPTVSFKNLPKVTNEPLLLLDAVLSEAGSIEVGTYAFDAYSGENPEVKIPIKLTNGENKIEFKLTDLAGNTAVHKESIFFEGDAVFNSVKTNEAIAYDGTPAIDGVLDDGWTLNRVIADKVADNSNASGVFGLMADKNNLYIAVKVYDSKVDDPGLATATSYLADSVEIFFDPEYNRGTKYSGGDQQIRLGLSGLAYSCTKATSLKTVKTASSRFEDGYIIEAAIPWNVISLEYSKGKKFGFEVSINDSSDGGVTRDGAVAWSADGNSYCNTSKFGTAYIGSK